MFDVSQEYLEKIKEPSRRTDINGIIALKNGEVINFSSSDLMNGSASYSNQCLNNNTFNLGSCYVGEYKMTIKTPADRYSLIGATVVVQYLVYLDDENYENIPIGTFIIDNAARVGKYVELTCYDEMSLIDKDLTESTSGKLKEIFEWICYKCNVSSGMDDDLWGQLVNQNLVVAFSNGIYTSYRDLLSDVAVLLGGYATIDRYGGLVIRTFKSESVDYIPDDVRKHSKFEDYKCKIRSAIIKTDKGAFVKDLLNDGIILELPDSKLLRAVEDDVINSALQNILDLISVFEYVPCSIDMLVNPAFDLGDMVTSVGYNTDDTDILSIIHSISWTFRSTMHLESTGENSRLSNAKSYAEKLAIEAGSSVKGTELKTIFYENASQIVLGPGETVKLFEINFTTVSNQDSVPMVHCQCNFNAVKGKFRIIYEFNDSTDAFTPTEDVFHDGAKLLTFFKGLQDATSDRVNKITVYLKAEDLIIYEKELQEDGGVYTLIDAPHTYSGGGTIEVGDLHVILQSTNLSFAEEWDGFIEIQENISPITVKRASEVELHDILTLIVYEYVRRTIHEEMHELTLDTLENLYDIDDSLSVIMDYDVLPYYELLYEQLSPFSVTSTTFNKLTYKPDDGTVRSCKGFYVQIPAGQGINASIDISGCMMYVLTQISSEGYQIAKQSSTGSISYTSDGSRFFILILGSSRTDDRAFNISTMLGL